MRLIDGMPWIPSDITNIRDTLKAHGHVPPEQAAREAEKNASIEGALRAMKRIQSETPKASVTLITQRRTKEK